MTTTKTRKSNTVAARKPTAVPTAAKTNNPALPATPVTGLVMGVLTGLTEEMTALVSFEGNPVRSEIAARTLAPLGRDDIGKMVALQFESGDIARPVIMGLLHSAAHQPATLLPTTASLLSKAPLQVINGDQEVTLVANRKLTLQCGRASITLDVDGNIELRGQNLLSRAAGQNRIKGSSIDLN